MKAWNEMLQQRLEAIQEQGLLRRLRPVGSPQGPSLVVDGRRVRNFSSNDYLGLAQHPALIGAAQRAAAEYGSGSGASRLVCGSLAIHHQLEQALAGLKGTEAALLFSSGYTAALGTLTALLGKEDIVVLDKKVHASIVDAARLCGAKLRVFGHNDLNGLERLLHWAAQRPATGGRRPGVLVVTESVFSMDGDQAPLRQMVELKDRYGAWLMVDEAHATGLYGADGSGLCNQFQVSSRVEIQMGTLGKALGASGGFICGSRKLIEYLVNRARSFIFSTGPAPAAVAPALAALELLRSGEGERRRSQLWERVDQVRQSSLLGPGGGHTGAGGAEGAREHPDALRSAIVPLVLGDENEALERSARLFERGFFIPAIRYPAVERGAARLRLTVSGAHTFEDVAALIRAWESVSS